MILVFRIGSIVPSPNVNVKVLKDTADAAKESNQLYGLVDLFSGGALLKLSIFALGIMPYITASIILQLLTVVIPGWRPSRKRASPARRRSLSTPAI